jgi:hypothetical protein
VAQCLDLDPHNPRVNSGRLFEQFNQHGWRLGVSGWDSRVRIARSFRQEIPKHIQTAAYGHGRGGKRVMLKTGFSPSGRALTREEQEYRERLYQKSMLTPAGHLLAPVVEYMRSQSGKVFRRTLKQNRDATGLYIGAMPTLTDYELSRYQSAERVHSGVEYSDGRFYFGGYNDSRIYTTEDCHPNTYPREVRRIAFGGAPEIDMTSLHPAIAARQLGVGSMLDILPNRFWDPMCVYCEVAPEREDLLKEAFCSLVNGMSLVSARKLIAEGEPRKGRAGLGVEVADRFSRWRCVVELISKREQFIRDRCREEHWYDADGRDIWQGASHDDTKTAFYAYLTSFEALIMLGPLPLFVKDPNAHILSWLHDGLTYVYGDKAEAERFQRAVIAALDKAAADMNIPSYARLK